MDKRESLALRERGKEAWNTWAKEMLSARAALEKAGKWEAEEEAWSAEARVDFSKHNFRSDADFADLVFPGAADFMKAVFSGPADFSMATFSDVALFTGAIFSKVTAFSEVTFRDALFDEVLISGHSYFVEASFSGIATFVRAKFSGDVDFDQATFAEDASFSRAKFSGDARFLKVMISGDAHFESASFSKNANFNDVTISGYLGFDQASFSRNAIFSFMTIFGEARFDQVSFLRNAIFDGAIFSGHAVFDQATFAGITRFCGTRFEHEVTFVAIKVESFFTLEGATFIQVPDFEQAHFAEAPRLDVADIRHSRRQLNHEIAEPDVRARWRALKRLAIQARDNERELRFFAEEIKAARGVQDKILPNPLNLFHAGKTVWAGGMRYWVGILYQLFSNFGNSILRPLLWWCVSTAVFWFIYLTSHFAAQNPTYPAGPIDWVWRTVRGWFWMLDPGLPALVCLNGQGEPWAAALYLSVRKGLIFAGRADAEKLAQTYACLYGEKVFPDTVAYAGLVQTVLSASLVFLFLLAVRNHFRIK